jgi:His-Xaa-Ser system protein HxsD
MSAPLSGFPPEVAHTVTAENAVELNFSKTLYPLDAVYGAAYIFIDRCYVVLDEPDEPNDNCYRVTLAWKKGVPPEDGLRMLAGEFANEILSCAWRAQIAKESRGIIEAVTVKALAGAMGPPTLDDLERFDFSDDAFEDPLGIAMSWEDKYGKKDGTSPASPERGQHQKADPLAETRNPTLEESGAGAAAGSGSGTDTGKGDSER